MFIIKNFSDKILKAFAAEIRGGAIVVYPTDTAYALGCDAGNAAAVLKIFKIKGRPLSKAFPMIAADLKMARKFFVLETKDSQLATRYWPGPLSIVLKAKTGIAKRALYKGTAPVRVPAAKLARELAKYLKSPLIATSANLSGRPACYSVKQFVKQMKSGGAETSLKDVIIFDAGALARRKPSTIIKVEKDRSITILRKGPVKFDISHSTLDI